VIEHIILFQAAELSDSEAADFLTRLEQLTKLPEVRAGTCGRNFSGRSRGFDYCLRLTFDDEAGLASYDSNPVHREFVAYRERVATDLICVDFEVAGGVGADRD
jgi:hypothetical protein